MLLCRELVLLIMFIVPSAALAEEEYSPGEFLGDVIGAFSLSGGYLQATQQGDNVQTSDRLYLRTYIRGIHFDGQGMHALDKKPFSFLRTAASGEWDTQGYALQSYNVDLDVFSQLRLVCMPFCLPITYSFGNVQLSHDELMGENGDISVKLLDTQFRAIKRQAPFGFGFNFLGYQQRQYQDNTTLKAVELAGIRFDLGFRTPDSRFEFAFRTDGDIGFGEGFVFDNLLEARFSIHKRWNRVQSRLQLYAQHNYHYNAAREENPSFGVYRVGGRLVFHLIDVDEKSNPKESVRSNPVETTAVQWEQHQGYNLRAYRSKKNHAQEWLDGIFRQCKTECGHLDVSTWNDSPIYVKRSGLSNDPTPIDSTVKFSNYWAYIYNIRDDIWVLQYHSPAIIKTDVPISGMRYITKAPTPWEGVWRDYYMPRDYDTSKPWIDEWRNLSIRIEKPEKQSAPLANRPDARKSLYIQASTANLRREPSKKSGVQSKLPIGTKGIVVKRQGEWVYFQTSKYTGWLHNSLIGEVKPTLENTLARFKNLSPRDFTERRKWIERAAAIAPKNRDVIELLVKTLEYNFNEVGFDNRSLWDYRYLWNARIGLEALKKKDSVYFTNKSFQDSFPQRLTFRPTLLSCRNKIRDIGVRGAEPPSKEMIQKWWGWGREVPKEEFWPTMQQNCFEFEQEKSIWSLIAKDGLASWKLIDIQPKLTVRTYLLDSCSSEDRLGPPDARVDLSWEGPEDKRPPLFFSTSEAPKTTSFPYISLAIPNAKPVPNMVSKRGNQIHRSILSGVQEDFGIRSIYLESEVGELTTSEFALPNATLIISLVVEWDSGKRSVIHSTGGGGGKYSYIPPEITDITLTDINQDGNPDILLNEIGIGYVLFEINEQSIKSTHTLERPIIDPSGGC